MFRPLFLKTSKAETTDYLLNLEKDYLCRRPAYQKGSMFRDLNDLKEADEIALAAGTRIREGSGTREDLDTIYDWKNGGSRFWTGKKSLQQQFASNCDARRGSTLARADKAVKAGAWLAAMRCLINPELVGVQVRTASAILTCIYPDRFTVLDELAIRPLGIYRKVNFDIEFYDLYLAECRKNQHEYGIELRSLDRAFWEWGKRYPYPPS
jgi:hypothetical protein